MPLFRMFRREIFGDGNLLSNAQPGVVETQAAFGMTEEDRIGHLVDLVRPVRRPRTCPAGVTKAEGPFDFSFRILHISC